LPLSRPSPHRPRRRSVNLGFWAWALLGTAAGFCLAAELPSDIDKALRLHKIEPDDLSLYLREVTEANPRLAVKTEVARTPASTIKLLTTIAALDRLGPDYRWHTRAYLGGPLVDGRLEGDLIIQGGGDPSLRPQDLWRFLWEMRARGLVTVSGDLVIDNSAFEPPETTRDAFDGKALDPYNALPVAFAVNFQATQIEVLPEPSTRSLRAYLVPPLANVTLVNQARLVQAPCRSKHHRLNLAVHQTGPATNLTLTGSFASECGQDSISRLLLDPVSHAGDAVQALWEGLGGTISGGVREGTVPNGATLFHTLDSDELALVVRDINKWSNNLMTRTLFLTLGMERFGRPATLAKGRTAVRDWLTEQGLDFPELVIDNGSGLSRETRISAGSLGRLLGWAYSNPEMSELTASLPIIGVDGTLHGRFKRDALRGQAHLKTGTLRGATGLAGFVDDAAGRRWILVSFINNPGLQGWRGKAVEDAILRWVYAGAPWETKPTQAPR